MAKKNAVEKYWDSDTAIWDNQLELLTIGSILSNSIDVNNAFSVLIKDDFFDLNYGHIFEAARLVFIEGEQPDIINVTRKLRSSKDESIAANLANLISITVSSTNSYVPYDKGYAIVSDVFNASLRRFIAVKTKEVVVSAFKQNVNPIELFNKVHADINDFYNRAYKNQNKIKISDFLVDYLNIKNEISRNESLLIGVTTGFREVNKITKGWQKTDSIVIAARPGMGKTAMLLSMALAAAKEGKKVLVLSLEMSKGQLLDRLFSMVTGISVPDIKQPRHSVIQSMSGYFNQFEQLPIYIDDNPIVSESDLALKVKYYVDTFGIEEVFIDYIQLMKCSVKTQNREQEVSVISKAIKAVAKQNDIPIISFSQLSRSVETRGGDKRPILSDLRESGSIEQDADIVAFIYRAAYYGIDVYDDGSSTSGTGELIIAKHRNGDLADIKLRFIGSLTKWGDYDYE